jgi:hypothetical protein
MHVMPSVGMETLAALCALQRVPGLLGDSTGCRVSRRMFQLKAVQPELMNSPVRHPHQRAWRAMPRPLAAGTTQYPIVAKPSARSTVRKDMRPTNPSQSSLPSSPLSRLPNRYWRWPPTGRLRPVSMTGHASAGWWDPRMQRRARERHSSPKASGSARRRTRRVGHVWRCFPEGLREQQSWARSHGDTRPRTGPTGISGILLPVPCGAKADARPMWLALTAFVQCG